MEKDKNSLLNIQKLAKMLDGNQLVTTEEFKSAVSDFINAFAQHRSAFGEISKKNDETMSTTLKNLQGEFDRVIGNSIGKEEARSMIDGGIKEIKAMVSAIQQIQGLKGENGKDGVNGKDADELNIVAQVLSRIKIPKQVKPDTPDEVVDKVNSSSKKIKKERVEGLEQAIMNSANNAVQSLPQTTMFVNGKRSKNLSVTGAGATVSTTGDTTTINITSGGGSGTVTDVSVVTANGVSGSVANSTTTPAITLSLGAITPSSVAAVGTVTGSNLSNTNTGDQTSIVGITGTIAQFNTALSDGDFATGGGTATGTNTGDQTSIVGITGTKAQFDTAVTDGNFMYIGDAPTAHTHTLSAITDVTASVAEVNVLDGIPGTLTATELGYVDGVTSAIQTQLDAKLPLAGGTMTGNITLGENASIALDPAGSADGKYSGITVTGTAGTTLAFGDLIYLAVADSRWELADADAATTADRMLGMCVLAAGADGNATTVLLQGIIRADAAFPALTIGAAVYVGETAGDIQVAIPTGADNVIRRVGYAMTADEIYFNPSMDSQITVA